MATEIEITTTRRAAHGQGMFRALSHRNFRLFWAGAFLSNVGTWMQAVAQGWLVLQLTNSSFWLGLDGFMATAPALVLTLLGGVFADLMDRRRLLLYMQLGAMASAFALAFLIMTGVVQPWMILVCSFITGCCMSLGGASFHALIIDLVGREDLPNAIALNSTQFHLSRVFGPVLAGLAIKFFGLAGCFFANGISFIAVIVALRMVRLKTTNGDAARSLKDKRAIWRDLIEGFSYVKTRPRVFMLLLISAMTSLFGAPYMALLPLYARDILRIGETGLSLMMGTSGVGAVIGALLLAFLSDFKHKGWVVLGGVFVFAVCLIGFAFATRTWISLILIFGMGFAIISSMSLTNTLLQRLVTDQMRGRVMSMYLFSFVGALPIGNLIAGAASHRFGAPDTLATGGLIVALFASILTIRNRGLRELS